MPLARSGEVHVLNMTTLPLQHVRTVETGFTVLTDICVLPMLRSDPLIICAVQKDCMLLTCQVIVTGESARRIYLTW